MRAPTPINIGIVGFGRIGAEHARWIEAIPSARVCAVADATASRRELAQQQGFQTHEKLERLLDDASIDAILVSLPTAMHFHAARQALLAGKHVMVEKPMTLNLAEATELAEIARRNGRVLSVFHNRRWDLDYLTVKQAIEAGTFGKTINIESRLGQWASCVGPAAKEWRPQWRNEASFGGGGLFDWGSHFIDQIWQLMLPARPIRVFAQLRGNVWSTDCDDFARVCVDFDSGAVGLVEINTTTTCPLPRWHIDGVAGSAEAPHSLEFDTAVWARLTFADAATRQSRLLPPPATPGLSNADIWDRFAAACRGEAAPAVTVESALVTMRLLDAARQSSERGIAVKLELTDSAIG